MAKEGYSPINVGPFNGGLNLRDQPDAASQDQAIDCIDVMFNDRGAVHSRMGSTQRYGAAGGASPFVALFPFYLTTGEKRILAAAADRIVVFDETFAVQSTTTDIQRISFTRYGGLAEEAIYGAAWAPVAPDGDSLKKWTLAGGWTTPSWVLDGGISAPNGKHVAVTPWDNRLVNACFVGTEKSDNPSAVRFSEEGNPLHWSKLWAETLTPGDGEKITGMCVWRDNLYVFKETKFFRFYGTTISTTGNPTFDYVPVSTGIGACSPRAICAGRDGVYFLSRTGVYRTRGADPELVSPLLDPLFFGRNSPFYSGGQINQAQIQLATMEFMRELIFMTIPTAGANTPNRVFVFDPRYNWWSPWSTATNDLAAFNRDGKERMVTTDGRYLYEMDEAYLDDNGLPINSFINFGFTDLNERTEKTIRETKLWGKGQVRFGLAVDFRPSRNAVMVDFGDLSDHWGPTPGVTDKWGPVPGQVDKWSSPAKITPELARNSARGTTFSLQLAAVNGLPWALNRCTYHVREALVPSVIKVDA